MKIKSIRKIKIEEPIRIQEVMSEKPRSTSGVENANIFIGTYQSLEKWPKEFFKQFYCVAVDESHTAKNATITKILQNTVGSTHMRYGLSGTFPKEDSAEILSIQNLIGPIMVNIGAKELMTLGTVTPVKIKIMILNHNLKELDEKLRRAKKNIDLARQVYEIEKKVCQESKERLLFIVKLLGKCNKNTLLLFNNIEFGERILNEARELLKDKELFYIAGEISNKERTKIIATMEDGVNKILIASYGCLSTGVSINNLHFLILAESFKSSQRVIQSIGRTLRLHDDKKIAIVFDIVDVFTDDNPRNIYFKHHEERMEMYNKEKYPYDILKINL